MLSRLKLRRNFFAWNFSVLLSAVVLQLALAFLKIPSACPQGHQTVTTMPFLIGSASLILLFSALIIWFYAKKLNDKFSSITVYARNIANGNFASGSGVSNDEEFHELVEILKNIEIKLTSSAERGSAESQSAASKQQLKVPLAELHDALEVLSAQSNAMLVKSKSITDQSHNAVSAAEEMHSNMISVSSAAAQSKKNMDAIAAVTGEMNCNIEEITQSSEKANSIMQEAVSGVKNAFESIDTLGKASEEITSVIETIVEIAEQTKLLALNATIEAARAGEAGKGFAVVASEVKDLAAQTNDATRDIKNKIEAMRRSTESTIDEIRKISDVTQSMTHVVATIAAAVEEQSISSGNISNTISDANVQTLEMSRNVADQTQRTNQLAEKIISIHKNISDNLIDINKISENSTHINALYQEICRNDLTS